jgi:hypothetical protein
MRLPYSKPYRAFVEFDRFSDEVCEKYAAMVRTKYARSRALASAGGVAVVGAWWGVLVLVGRVLVSFAGVRHWVRNSGPWADIGLAVVLILVISAGPLMALVVRDYWFRWALRRQLGGVRCGACDYLLLGLTVEEGRVRCPECGGVTVLAERGLTEADVMAPVRAQGAAGAEPGAGAGAGRE